MNKIISLKLSFILLFSALSSLAPVFSQKAHAQDNCENGECVNDLIERVQDLGSVYQRECLPSEGVKVESLKNHFEENGLSERCWQLITQIQNLESTLQKHMTHLEEKLGCQSGDCKLNHQDNSLNSQLLSLSKVEQTLACTIPKKAEIKKKCPQDLTCALAAGAMGAGGYLAQKIFPGSALPKNCHLGDDSCTNQLALGFIKAVVSFFEGAWDLLKLGANKARAEMKNFWKWVSGAENHSSNAQLALARASEDPGVFDSLIKDFPGTMKQIWSALVESIRLWFKKDIFCQKWSGVPHFSQCLSPTENFDCLPCKTMINGMCAISGTFLSEIVPAFLTGGLTTAVKYGAQGAVKIAKLFRVSPKALKVIKESRMAKIAVEAAAKSDEALKLTKNLNIVKKAVGASLALIQKYLLSPGRKVLKDSYQALSSLVKSGSVHVAQTKMGKVLIFSGKAIKLSGKAIIYPVDNPLTTLAFKSGMRTFEKAFKLGQPKLANTPLVNFLSERISSSLQTQMVKHDLSTLLSRDIGVLEKKALYDGITPIRKSVLNEVLKSQDVDFDELVELLYPELLYSDLAKSLPKNSVLGAERELYLAIDQMSDGPQKSRLLKSYQDLVAKNPARSVIIPDESPVPKIVVDNAQLPDQERLQTALKLIQRTPDSPETLRKLSEALKKAHLVGEKNGVFEYSWSELREKHRLLLEGGFTEAEANLLIRHGLAGRPPVRELFTP